MLDAENQPIYPDCREVLSKLSLAVRMIKIKTDHNLHENCMDAWAELFKKYMPKYNLSAKSYYQIQKLVYSLKVIVGDDRCLHRQLYDLLKRLWEVRRESFLQEDKIHTVKIWDE